ncbi:MAG: RHS repeat-associated core domain-containing protein [Planctomycetaceae bacterium]
MTTTKYLWNPKSDNILLEKDEFGTTQATYTHEPGLYGNLISQRRGNDTSYYHFDSLGSTRALTDSSQQVTDTNLYDAWGIGRDRTGTSEDPFWWVGEKGYYTDADTGTLQVRARTYEPAIARWWSADPFRRAFDGTFNRFNYSFNSPVVFVDPSGLIAAPNFRRCVIDCEDLCATLYLPRWWNPWYTGCIAGCPPGCKGQDFTFCSYYNSSIDECYKDALQCACGLVGIADILTGPIPIVGGLVGALDCACEVLNVVSAHCAGDLHRAKHLTWIAALDCAVDILGAAAPPIELGSAVLNSFAQMVAEGLLEYFGEIVHADCPGRHAWPTACVKYWQRCR